MGVAVLDIETGKWEEPNMTDFPSVHPDTAKLAYADVEIARLRSEVIRLSRQRMTPEQHVDGYLAGKGRNLDLLAHEWEIMKMQCEARGFDHPFKLVEAWDQIMGAPIAPVPSGGDLGAPVPVEGIGYLGGT